ncbi:hypothetical protein CK203_012753 [Vitis vinifera]|uniref:Uncharacterized protein n=1 Tax=Vitis vinifera TaxID=29760 RepID=A0A438KMS3_VITVI|nr:hypothetical protein CK203_012753 [Vitis vinifera]
MSYYPEKPPIFDHPTPPPTGYPPAGYLRRESESTIGDNLSVTTNSISAPTYDLSSTTDSLSATTGSLSTTTRNSISGNREGASATSYGIFNTSLWCTRGTTTTTSNCSYQSDASGIIMVLL